jgi:predicted AAA+ superfamily ATPase
MTASRFPHSYTAVLETLRSRLEERSPGRIQLLSGPRQVGKTHLLWALGAGYGDRAIYAAADAPAASTPGWWEAQWRAAEDSARPRRPAILMIDEIQYLPDWGRRLKAEYDRLTRRGTPVHVVVTGSSSLRIGRGAKEAMAGRFERLALLHWPVREVVERLALREREALRVAIPFGTYPGAMALVRQPERWRAYVRGSIIEPAIGRDILALEAIRKPALLRQLFALAAGHPAEIISLQKLRGRLDDAGAVETVRHYLEVLEQAYLVAPIEKYSGRALRRRSAPPKLVVLNQALLGAMADEGPKAVLDEPGVLGRWVENACIACAWNAGQKVWYWRAEPLEVDLVTSGSWGRWAVEVKTGSYRVRDLAGLLEFCKRYRGFRPLVLCDRGKENVARDANVACVPWQSYLLSGPPA